jgi:hypothetical protein
MVLSMFSKDLRGLLSVKSKYTMSVQLHENIVPFSDKVNRLVRGNTVIEKYRVVGEVGRKIHIDVFYLKSFDACTSIHITVALQTKRIEDVHSYDPSIPITIPVYEEDA